MSRSNGAERTPPEDLTRQGRETRSALLSSARRVFEERGYHGTRIADITSAADVSVGTFYSYFNTKEELFRVLLIELEAEVYGELSDPTEDTGPQERIEETNRLYFGAFERNARIWAAVEEAALTNPDSRRVLMERHDYYRSRTSRALERWSEAGLLDHNTDIALAAELLGAMTENCAYLWYVFGETMPDSEDPVRDITRLWIDAIGLDTGSRLQSAPID